MEPEVDLDDLIGSVDDALGLAADLKNDLLDKSDLLDNLSRLATELHADLDTSQSVETVDDFYANLKEAGKKLDKLLRDITSVTVAARKDDDEIATEALGEAKATAKALKRELSDLEPE